MTAHQTFMLRLLNHVPIYLSHYHNDCDGSDGNGKKFMGKCPSEELAFPDVRMMGALIEIPVGARDHVPSSLTGG